MKLGEICILTKDVVRLADFYRQLLGIEESCLDPVHQTILRDEPMLTIYNDGMATEVGQNMCIAFTVEDMDAACKKVCDLGATVLEMPTRRPWGAVNMRFLDPDGNTVYLRCFPKEGKVTT